MPIEILPPEVVGKIAAGEVIERPASVVKELVENALDAGARSIHVEIVAGGRDLVRVADDGHGIPREELPLAVQRHATSKIRRAEDLSRVTTLGFRGEALASIAAVSSLTLTSRTAEGAAAHQIRVRGGVTEGPVAAARAPGVTVTVEDLFFNLPARRKFLRSPASETAQVANVLTQMAVAHPEVAFRLVADGRKALSTPGSGNLLDAALAVLGRDVARALLPVEATVEGDQQGRSLAARISGYVADPEVSRSTRSGIWLFVNRRPIKSRTLSHAVEEGYRTLLQVDRHPVAVLNLEVPPWEVDVNVHPTKTEVRLLRERLIYGGLRDAVRSTVVLGSVWGREVSTLSTGSGPAADQAAGQFAASRLIDAPVASAPLGGQGGTVGGRRLPILRLMGQVAQTYIVAEGEHGLYLIDQHAAHERVLYDRLMASLGREGNTQLLLEPVPLDMSPAQWGTAVDARGELESLGYLLETFGERSLLVRGVPTELPQGRAVQALQEALQELSEEKPGPGWRERVVTLLSCRGAVKAGQPLAMEEMRSLVEALEETDISQHCSHGRPTAILLSRSQLEREFGRR